MNKSNEPSIVCFGEILWDVFNEQKKPGGAPFNVAVHLSQFGLKPKLISKVGLDELGNELMAFVKSKSITSAFIQEDSEQPTGVVNVEVGDSGDAKYDIVFPSAWDFIHAPNALNEEDFILIFGSLASRNSISRSTLLNLIEKAELTLFDVNFRAPHYSRDLIEQLLEKSDIVKLNEDEVAIIGSWLGEDNESIEHICAQLSEKYGLDHIIVTLGSRGAMVCKAGAIYRNQGIKVKVADTVGSGDSFLASYLAHYLQGCSVEKCLKMACATGALVASKNGAVPEYEISEIKQMANIREDEC